VDYAAPKGTPVMSIGDGTVIKRAYQKGGGGNYLKIKHNSVYTTTYMHLAGFAKGITEGSRVKQGQVIGYVGSTGISTGPHLDFRVSKNGSLVDPLKVKAPPVEPVKDENMPRYTHLKDSLFNELQKIKWEPEILVDNR
jgi:murein DD-endopeptidase MepM/ murein hydrolase activator NlpD